MTGVSDIVKQCAARSVRVSRVHIRVLMYGLACGRHYYYK